jgi:hypothetical protein
MVSSALGREADIDLIGSRLQGELFVEHLLSSSLGVKGGQSLHNPKVLVPRGKCSIEQSHSGGHRAKAVLASAFGERVEQNDLDRIEPNGLGASRGRAEKAGKEQDH